VVLSLLVLIAGAGIGGLCLAQALRQGGVDVAVYERDASAAARRQGYRLRIDVHGRRALRSCLPAELYALFEATANQPYMSRGAVFDERLATIYRARSESQPFDPATASTAVNRLTLRQVLLAGLDDVVRFDHEVTGFSGTEDGVRVEFADGASATGDVLVAADGVHSAIRARHLPGAEVIDTGLRAIYGQALLDEHLLARIPETLFTGSSPVLGPHRRTLALGAYQPCVTPVEAAARLAPYAALDPIADYMKWTLVAPIEEFTVPEAQLWAADPATLHGIALGMIDGWHETLRDLLHRSVVPTVFPLAIRGTRPVPAWKPSRVTMLGDAIHATTPVGGTGANTALRDAELLAGRLIEASTGLSTVLEAVAGYEELMRDYGSTAVLSSLRGAEKIFRADPIPV
jgi:2-polyprenyl-6-methoxyphenol hydroxylase-like FAD-dependent oxidoreductase